MEKFIENAPFMDKISDYTWNRVIYSTSTACYLCRFLVIFITLKRDFSHWQFRTIKTILREIFFIQPGFASQAFVLFTQRSSISMYSNNQILALQNIKER
jgi:hypothetical protein